MPYYARRYRKKTYPRSYSRYRRPYRSRKRFSRKRFTKYSSKQKTVVRAPVNARETYVKLPWQVTTTETFTSTQDKSYYFLGNSLNPVPATPPTGSTTPTVGTLWASGVEQYTGFYSNYRVLGSSIRVRFVVATSSGSAIFRVLLIPVMSNSAEESTNYTDKIMGLDALDYDQLSVQPYAQYRTVGLGTGANAVCNFKMFRKTKSMTAIKDVRDEKDLSAKLPQNTGDVTSGQIPISSSLWFYYLRIFNTSTSTIDIDVSVTMKFYTQLYGRDNYVPLVASLS